MGYMSKDFVDLLLQLSETAKEAGMMEQLGEAKPEIDKALADLKLIKQGSISTMSRTEDGILFTERGVKNLQERMKELDEAMKKMEEGLEGLKPQ
jgi:prefoldin subunit 5